MPPGSQQRSSRPEDIPLAESHHGALPDRFGPYEIVSLLGEGGMARVYRAVRRGPMGFSKELAIKAIRASGSGDSQELANSLVNEARLGGQLRHPNLADTYEFGMVGEQFYIAMEYVNGPTLRTLLRGFEDRNLHLPWGAVLDLALQTCDGLQYMHALCGADGVPLNLIHRDLKPENIIVSTAGLAKVMDFGIARSTSALHPATLAGSLKGTPGFISPEQLNDPDSIDARSDLFALGTILFECVVGQPLITAANVEAMMWSIASGSFRSRLDLIDEVLHLLARPGLAEDQNGNVRGRQPAHDVEHLPHGRAAHHGPRPAILGFVLGLVARAARGGAVGRASKRHAGRLHESLGGGGVVGIDRESGSHPG